MFATDTGGGAAILVRRGIDHYAVPVSGLEHLEDTAIHLVLTTRPVKLVAAYIPPTRPLIESEISKYLSGVFPVVMAADLNAKHTNWNWLTIARVSLLRDYAIRNTCLMYGPDSPTTAPYTKCYSRRPRHSGCKGHRPTGVSYCLVCTQLGSPTYPDRHHVPVILQKPTGPPRLHANGLGCSRFALMTDSRGIPW
jgi:hypothetical protein